MHTRSRLKKGEGKLEVYNPEIGSRRSTRNKEMATPRKTILLTLKRISSRHSL